MLAEWNTLATHPTSVAHTDGTIIALDGDSVVGIDPATGLQKFSVQLDHSTGDSIFIVSVRSRPSGQKCEEERSLRSNSQVKCPQ